LNTREIVCEDLSLALDDLRRDGFRLDVIYPADEPHTALLSRDGTRVRLTSRPGAPPVTGALPAFSPRFVLTRASTSAGEGRAGMLYRDLVPDRLGGRYIASHISIPAGGPVADWVHFHKIALQLIYVRRGWVRVVYEDQGDPFVMDEGDLVLQPPEIRHRVLESSPGLEVIEIGAPALHETFADHDLVLPSGLEPAREFRGQKFHRHQAAATAWTVFGAGEAQETGIAGATGGLAAVRKVRAGASGTLDFAPHEGELVLGVVLAGSAKLDFAGMHALGDADAFVIPPGQAWGLRDASRDFSILHVTTAQLD
jgi:quercetin dioxygenase-like cupin family protein